MNSNKQGFMSIGAAFCGLYVLGSTYRYLRRKSLLQKRCEGKVAVVTGAGSGVGKSLAQLMADLGWKVYAVDMNAPGLKELVDKYPGLVIPVQTNLMLKEDMEKVHDVVSKDPAVMKNGLDVLVNNAGVTFGVPALGITYQELQLEVGVNLIAPMYLSGLFVKLLTSNKGGGVIVNTSSIAGKVAWPWQGVYAATKFGLEGFRDLVRREAKSSGLKLRICNILPGGINTPMGQAIQDRVQKYLDQNQDHPFIEGYKKNAKSMEALGNALENEWVILSARQVAEQLYLAAVDPSTPSQVFVIAPLFKLYFNLVRMMPNCIADRML